MRPDGIVDIDKRAFVIDQVLAKLREFYVSEAMAQKMEADIRVRHTAGDYNRLTSAAQFVQVLTRDLQATSGDRHLLVEFSAEAIDLNVPSRPPDAPVYPRPPSETVDPHPGSFRPRDNCLFVNVAALPGSIGYIKFDKFLPPDRCAETAAAAMNLVADCDALLIDLRDNSGGDPFMVAFLSSYFFSKPVHLSDIYERRTNVTVESWTLPFVPGRKFLGKPIFILTSSRTFSAAEEFAFNLQALKRAVVVGDASGGGAHPALSLRIDEHFQITVPVARYINPISRTNWEGKGVAPDIRTRENVTVQTAYRAALEDVIRTTASAEQRAAVQGEIDTLTKVIDALQ